MSWLDEKFNKRGSRIKRNYEIEDLLYGRLVDLTQTYEASVSDLVNFCIQRLIATENLVLYKRESSRSATHSVLISESNILGLAKLKDKYNVSMSKLVNIAIKNVIDESLSQGEKHENDGNQKKD